MFIDGPNIGSVSVVLFLVQSPSGMTRVVFALTLRFACSRLTFTGVSTVRDISLLWLVWRGSPLCSGSHGKAVFNPLIREMVHSVWTYSYIKLMGLTDSSHM